MDEWAWETGTHPAGNRHTRNVTTSNIPLHSSSLHSRIHTRFTTPTKAPYNTESIHSHKSELLLHTNSTERARSQFYWVLTMAGLYSHAGLLGSGLCPWSPNKRTMETQPRTLPHYPLTHGRLHPATGTLYDSQCSKQITLREKKNLVYKVHTHCRTAACICQQDVHQDKAENVEWMHYH